MKTIDLIQGTPEWDAHRAQHDNASDAAAAQGDGKHMTRNQLMTLRKSGPKEVSKWVQENLYDKGHGVEDLARARREESIGEDLYPITAVSDLHPRLSASFDGITADEETAWEHKMWNEELAAMIRAKDLSPAYYWQLEQQFLVGEKLKRIIFETSDGNGKSESMEYTPVPGRAQKLLAGWKQFHEDLAAFTPVEVVEVIGRAPEALPALNVEVTGLVKFSNVKEFKDLALARVASLNMDLSTDQDFADAAEGVRWCETLEDTIDATKTRLINQTASFAEILNALDEIKKSSSGRRITLTNTIKARKDKIKADLIVKATADFKAHVDGINARLVRVTLPPIPVAFTESLKNKRTNASLQNAIDTELARVKIRASEVGDKFAANLILIDEQDADYKPLFTDLNALVAKEADDLRAVIQSRIATHKAEQDRIAERNRLAEEARVASLAKSAEAAPIVIAQTQPAAPTPESLQPQPALREQPTAAPTVANDTTVAAASDVGHESGSATTSRVVSIGFASRKPKTDVVTTDDEIIAAVAQRFGWTTRDAVVRMSAIPFNEVLNNLQEHA